MKIPERIQELCRTPIVVRSRFSGRLHNGDHLSRSVAEEKEFMQGNKILENPAYNAYQTSGAIAFEGGGSEYFDIYFLTGCGSFTHFKSYSPGTAHAILGTRRDRVLMRTEKIKKNSTLSKMYYYDTSCFPGYNCEIGVRIYADRSWDYLYADKNANVLVVRPKSKMDEKHGATMGYEFIPAEKALKHNKAKRNSHCGIAQNCIPNKLYTIIMRAPDIDKCKKLMPTERNGVYELSERAMKIVEKVFPSDSPIMDAYMHKQGVVGQGKNRIVNGKHLYDFITTPLRIKSQKTLDTVNEIKAEAAKMFEEAAPYRRRLSSQYGLLKICGNWLMVLIRYYAASHYDIYAVNLKNGEHHAINTSGSVMPFVISRISRTRIILQGTEDSFADTKIGKIMKANPPNIDRRESDVAGMHIVTYDTCLLNALRKGYDRFLEQAVSLNLVNIVGCLLDDTINAIPKANLEEKRAELKKGMVDGRYWYYYRDDIFDNRAYTLNANATNLVKAFDLPMAKIKQFDKMISDYTLPRQTSDRKTDVRFNVIPALFDVNVGSLDDETFKSAVYLTVKSNRSQSASLIDLYRELPENEKTHSDLHLLRKMASYSDVFGTLRDYMRLRKEVKNIPGVQLDEVGFPLFPEANRVEALHNRLVAQKTDYENMGRAEKLKRMNKAYEEGPYKKAKKLDFTGDDTDKYIIVAVKKVEELDYESNTLHHCVSSYKDSVANGVEYIAFLRKKEAPDIPFITMDVDPKWKVRQIHGKYNSDLDDMDEGPELKAFLEKWAQAKDFIDKTSLSGHYGALCHM